MSNQARLQCLIARVVKRATCLQHVPDTSIEIVFVSLASPKRDVFHPKFLHHQPRNRSMQLAHHFAQLLTIAQTAFEVIVIVHQSCDPGNESMQIRVVMKPIPENRLGCFRFEGGKTVSNF
jgi:hypothetical protein